MSWQEADFIPPTEPGTSGRRQEPTDAGISHLPSSAAGTRMGLGRNAV